MQKRAGYVLIIRALITTDACRIRLDYSRIDYNGCGRNARCDVTASARSWSCKCAPAPHLLAAARALLLLPFDARLPEAASAPSPLCDRAGGGAGPCCWLPGVFVGGELLGGGGRAFGGEAVGDSGPGAAGCGDSGGGGGGGASSCTSAASPARKLAS